MQFSRMTLQRSILATLATLLLAANIASAEEYTQRLRSPATVKGFVGGESHDSYVIRARKGHIEAEKSSCLQLLRKHGLDPGLLQMARLFGDVERSAWIQRAGDDLQGGESPVNVMPKIFYLLCAVRVLIQTRLSSNHLCSLQGACCRDQGRSIYSDHCTVFLLGNSCTSSHTSSAAPVVGSINTHTLPESAAIRFRQGTSCATTSASISSVAHRCLTSHSDSASHTRNPASMSSSVSLDGAVVVR